MALTRDEKIQLIEAYEPILYFHPDEKFVPVKPDAYMQTSALWHSQPPSHDKSDWGTGGPGFPRQPLIPKRGISVNPAYDFEGAQDPDGDGVGEYYIGHEQDGRAVYLISNDERELWLDMAGWLHSTEVSASSLNAECSGTVAEGLWQREPLDKSLDWYFAEVEDLDTLTDILALIREDGLDLGKAIREILGDAFIIWYYFLYPIHEENLRGCEETLGAGAHGNYEGDWNAIGILVRKPATWPWEGGDELPAPDWIGYGRRGRGPAEVIAPDLLRTQMNIHPWSEIFRVGRHPKVFVSKGSHNNYVLPGPHEPPSISGDDLACGAIDEVSDAIDEVEQMIEDIKDVIDDILVFVAKAAAGCAIGAIFAGPIGCGIGAVVGAIAGGIEGSQTGSDNDSSTLDESAVEELERDHPPDQDDYGLVLTPETLTNNLPDGANAVELRPWADTPENRLVDRELQVWWPGEGQDPGYQGRWGVMCQNDPHERRSGIVFPNFKRAFLLDLAIDLSS